jgi:hypothetical protein
VTTGKGREKSGESEENRERDVEGDTCHLCIEREKKIFAIVNSTECNCAALQLLLLLVLAGKKNVFIYFNDSRVYRERKKILSNSQLTLAMWHYSCCCYCAGWKKKKILFVYFNDKK